MPRSIPILLAASVLAAGLGACGGEGGGRPSADRAAELRDAGLRFARCMRANGVDVPDPKTDERGVTIVEGGDAGPGAGRPSARLRTAERRCRRHLDDAEPPKLSAEEQQDFRRQALAHARCMRRNGVDFPDPAFSEDGGARVNLGPGSGLDPSSPAFRRAEARCRALMHGPGAGPGSGS